MYIDLLKLENFKGITNMELPLNGRSSVFFGVNGVGKSSILPAVNILFSNIINKIVANRFKQGISIDFNDITFGKTRASISAEFQMEGFPCGYARHIDKNANRRTHNRIELDNLYNLFEALFLVVPEANMPILVNYGVNRSVVDIPLRIRTKHEFDKLSTYQNAIESKIDFRTFFEWYRYQEDFENQVKVREDPNYSDISLRAAQTAITSFMEGFSNLRVDRNPLAMKITKQGRDLRIEQLSDGEKCTIALLGDLSRRLALANPSLDNPLEGKGIVLIDEIELHMHTQWQRKILPKLKEIFPNIQFLITTHSPQVLGEIDDSYNLFFLERSGYLSACTRIDSLYGWDSNTILEDKMNTPSRNSDIQEKSKLMFQMISEKKYREASALADDIAVVTNDANEDVTYARVLIAKGLRNEKNS